MKLLLQEPQGLFPQGAFFVREGGKEGKEREGGWVVGGLLFSDHDIEEGEEEDSQRYEAIESEEGEVYFA